MPERVYTNRIPGQERIHIEVAAAELPGLLRNITIRADDAALQLLRILEDSRDTFAGLGIIEPAAEEAGGADWLRDRIVSAARTVPLRLGPNALGMVSRGEGITLSGGEADAIADEVLAIIRPLTCGASAEGLVAGLLGPCVLAPVHDGPVHQGPSGERWLRRENLPLAGREMIHGCPPDGSGVTPCCNMTPFELPRTDRLTENRDDVNCSGTPGRYARQAAQGKGTAELPWRRRLLDALTHSGPGYAPPTPAEVLRDAADAYDAHHCDATGHTPGLTWPCDHTRNTAAWLRARADQMQPPPEPGADLIVRNLEGDPICTCTTSERCPACKAESSGAAERTARAESTVARVQEWIAGEPVTARSEFGNGYREALRDITTLLQQRSEP